MPAGLSSGPRFGYDARVGAGLSRGPNKRRQYVAAAWSGTWPAPGATLDLDFANNRGFVRGLGQGGAMDGVTFTRASVGTYVDSTGTMQSAASGAYRLDWASTARTGSGTAASPYVIPLAAATTCNGLLIEESRANRLLWCRDATQANWTATNVTPLKDQAGIDGVANAASSLTASADGGTCVQTVTLASGSRTSSVYLKRITGTGNVQVSIDGTTWSTVDLTNGIWNRCVMSGTVTNPTVGVKLAVNGDAVALDYGQIEDGAFATSPILTTTASATRSADLCDLRNPWLGRAFSADINKSQNALSGTVSLSFTRGLYPSSGTTYNYLVLNAGGGANEYVIFNNRADNGGIVNPQGASTSVATASKLAVSFDYRSAREESAQDGRRINDTTLSVVASEGLYNYDKLAIGNNGRTAVTVVAQAWIKRLIIFPTVAGASILQALSGVAT